MPTKFVVLGGGVFWVLAGGGEVPILFLWARGSLKERKTPPKGEENRDRARKILLKPWSFALAVSSEIRRQSNL